MSRASLKPLLGLCVSLLPIGSVAYGAAGGVVRASCEGDGFQLSAEGHRFMVDALPYPLAEASLSLGD